jgi:polar amino acid transport system substrate-binding protein
MARTSGLKSGLRLKAEGTMRKGWIFPILLAASGILFTTIGCGRQGSTSAVKPLVVGMDLSYPPFETIGSDGQPSGVSVDLAMALGESLHRPVRIENIPFTGLIPSLLTGKIDLILSSMTDTPERRQSIAFSDPYLTIGLAALAGRNSSLSGNDLDHPGRTIAVRQGTTAQAWATDHLKQAKVIVLDKESSAVLEVIQGKADAFLYDQMSVWKNQKEHPAETVALLAPIQTEHWAIGLRPSDTALRDGVNAFLKSFRASGGFDRLGDKHLKEQKEAFAAAGIPFYF